MRSCVLFGVPDYVPALQRYMDENRQKLAHFKPVLESPFESVLDFVKPEVMKSVFMLRPQLSIDGDLKRFKKGAAILSSNTGAPIVPIAIEGAYDVWPRNSGPKLSRFLPFVGKVRMALGTPLAFASGGTVDYQSRTGELRERVQKLLDALRAAF